MLHKNASVGDLHYIQNWEVADETARLALVLAEGDVGKVAFQIDTKVFYILSDWEIPNWTALALSSVITDFTQLADVPASYTGSAGYSAIVNPTEDGLIFEPISSGAAAFTDLTDTPSAYTGQAGNVVAVNDTEDGLEFIAPSGGGGSSAVGFAALKGSVASTGGSDITGFTEIYDTGSCFNPTTGVFQPATAGVYKIDVTANFFAAVNVALNHQEVQIYDSALGIIYSLTVRAVRDANGTAPNLSGSIYAVMDGTNSITINYTSANASMIINTVYFSATKVD